MAKEREFVREGIRQADIEEFLANEFARAGYSHCDIQRTPLSMRIIVHASKPGLVIGRGGRNIDNITKTLKERFQLENPQLDVREVEVPELDAQIIAKQIASALERGLNFIRVANVSLQRVMEAGAVGVQIIISGKIGGDMSRTEKFAAGYLKHAGEPAEELVRKGFTTAQVKLGTIGVRVKILTELPEEIEISKRIEKKGEVEEETEEVVEAKEEKPVESKEKKKEKSKEEKVEKKETKERKEDKINKRRKKVNI